MDRKVVEYAKAFDLTTGTDKMRNSEDEFAMASDQQKQNLDSQTNTSQSQNTPEHTENVVGQLSSFNKMALDVHSKDA